MWTPRVPDAVFRATRGALAGPGARFRFERPARFEPPELDRAGLYVHVPFCRSLCPYCPYNRVPYERELADAYVDALVAEAAFYGSLLPNVEIDSVYFGGGTPTTIDGGLIRITEAVRRHFRLTGPVCVETHPADLTEDKVRALARVGVDAVSVGVESFQPRLLDLIGRRYSPEQARRAIGWLREADIPSIHVDLMFALPTETIAELTSDLEAATRTAAGQVTAYPLFTFPYTTVGLYRRLRAVESPRLSVRRRMYHALSDFFEERGWHRVSVWSFKRSPPDAVRFSSVMRRRYVGLGPGAGSWLGSRFTLNTFSVPEYVRAVARQGQAVALEMKFTPRMADLYDFYWDVYGTEVARRNGSDEVASNGAAAPIEALMSIGESLDLAESGKDAYRLTRRGAFWVHLLQNQFSLRAVDRIWTAARATPWPEAIAF